jgi:hypothetical protein
MLDANDIQVLRKMFAETEQGLGQRLGQKIAEECEKVRADLTLKITQECDRVRDDVIDVMNMNVIPQLGRLEARVTRLERLQAQA